MKTSKVSAMLVLGLALSAHASPVADFTVPETVIQGYISSTPAGMSPTFTVKSTKVFLKPDTVIKTRTGSIKPSELMSGMLVRVEGISIRAGVMAKAIYVLER